MTKNKFCVSGHRISDRLLYHIHKISLYNVHMYIFTYNAVK